MYLSLFNVYVPLSGPFVLLFNSISRRLIRISSEELSDLECGSLPPWNPLILRLLDGHFVTPDPQKQYETLRSLDHSSKKSPSTHHLTLMMSEACNFSCSYCNQGSHKDSLTLSRDTFDSIISYVNHVSQPNHILDVSWFGGEPLLHLKLLAGYSKELSSLCAGLGVHFKSRVITNGYLLNPSAVGLLLSSSITGAQVSFDGSFADHNASRNIHPGHDSYSQILNNIAESLRAFPDFSIVLRVNSTSQNISHHKQLIDDLYDRGLSGISNFYVYWGHIYDPTLSRIADAQSIDSILLSHQDFADAELYLNRYLRERGFQPSKSINLTQGNCIATQQTSLLIRPNGDLHKCYIPVSNPSYGVGHIDDFLSIDSNDVFTAWNNWSAFDESNCSGCRLLGSCRGGCPINYIMPDFGSGDYRCPPNKLRLNEHLFDIALDLGIVTSDDWSDSRSSTDLSSLRMSVDPSSKSLC